MKNPLKEGDDIKQVKWELRKSYDIIRNTYKFLAAIGAGTGGGAWYINLNTYTDFVKLIGLVDNEAMMVESDMQFNSINKRTKMTPTNPQIGLVWFQFLEILMRLAFKKYFDLGKCGSYSEAIRLLNKNHIDPIFGGNFSESIGDAPKLPSRYHYEWRHQVYWNEEVDNLYKSHKELFERVF